AELRLAANNRCTAARRGAGSFRLAPLVPFQGQLAGGLGGVGEGHEVEVLGVDFGFFDESAAHPVDQAAPVIDAKEHDGEALDLAGLNQGEGFEELVEGAEAARE